MFNSSPLKKWSLQETIAFSFRAKGTLMGTITYPPPKAGTFEDDVPIPMVGYVSSLENKLFRGLSLFNFRDF